MLVAGELDIAHLDRGAFLDVEVHLHGGRGDGLDFGLDGGELVAMLRQHVAEHGLGAFDCGRVELAFHARAQPFPS